MSGFSLDRSPNTLLALHLISGVCGLVPVAFFLRHHWWHRREGIKNHPNTWLGYNTLICLIMLTITGAALLVWTNFPLLNRLHLGATYVLLLGLAAHLSWRLRAQWLASHRRRSLQIHFNIETKAFRRWVILGLVALGMVLSLD